MTDEEVRELLRRACKAAGSQTRFAKAHHVDRSTISLILGAGKVEHAITPAVLKALGLRKIVVYEPE